MEFRESLFPPNSSQEESSDNSQESVGFSALSNIMGPTSSTYLLQQEFSNTALFQIAEYPFINDLILTEDTFTRNDELFAISNHPITQYEENGLMLAQPVDAAHEQLLSDSVALHSHEDPDSNAVLQKATASDQQYTAGETDPKKQGNYGSLKEALTAVGNNSSLQNDFDLEQISGRDEKIDSPGIFHVLDLLPLTIDPADGSPVLEPFSTIENEHQNETTNWQSTLHRSTSTPMNDSFQDQSGMSPEDIHIAFSDQDIGGFLPNRLTGMLLEVENNAVHDPKELRDERETNFLGKTEQNDLHSVIGGTLTGTEPGQMALLMEDGSSRGDLDKYPVPGSCANMLPDQTYLTNGLETTSGMDYMTSAEKIRTVFLYPMYKQMQHYQNRYENSRRNFRRGAQNAKYYAMKRLLQDVRINLEIAQKATVVSRQLKLEREQVEKEITKEKRDVSILRTILEKYAIGKSIS